MKEAGAQALRSLGYFLLEYKGGGLFRRLSEPPDWFEQLWPEAATEESLNLAERFPFLESFLPEAEELWAKGSAAGQMIDSGMWVESSVAGKELALQAYALKEKNRRLLALHNPASQYAMQANNLQLARDAILRQERYLREVQKKEILLHTIVHDLSQPLGAMRGALECLGGETGADAARKFLDLGKRAAEQQEEMIREILQAFSADLQESLDSKTAGQAASLREAADSAIATMTPAYAAKGVALSLQVAGDFRDAADTWNVRGESTRLRRIFSNLLENALRYTPSGRGVVVGLEQDGEFRRAFVDDEGPGLPADLRPERMFALFSKGQEGGGKAGLGLYFCRITVERWGGSIGCNTRREGGSRFRFRLPAVNASQATAVHGAVKEAGHMQQERPAQTPLKILLADDQNDVRTLTEYQLQRRGHQVTAVRDGQNALNEARATAFDVLLLDEEMPRLTGPEVVKALLKEWDVNAPRPRIVALTGNNTPTDRARLMEAGFDAVIGKPFHAEALEELLHEGTALVVAAASANVEAGEVGDELLLRVGGDKKLLTQMIRTFLKDTEQRMAAMEACVKQKNAVDLAAYAHALKGSVSIFHAEFAARQAQALQTAARAADMPKAGSVFREMKEEIAKLQEKLRGYLPQSKTGAAGASHEEHSAARKSGKRRKE